MTMRQYVDETTRQWWNNKRKLDERVAEEDSLRHTYAPLMLYCQNVQKPKAKVGRPFCKEDKHPYLTLGAFPAYAVRNDESMLIYFSW